MMSNDYHPRANPTKTQQQIIEAAIDQLATRGYAQTSVGDIAIALRRSKGNVQYHFPSKEMLFQETIAYIYGVAFKEIRPGIDSAGDPWECVRQFIIGSITFYIAHPAYVQALRELKFNFRPVHHRSYATLRFEKEMIDVGELLLEGQRKGVFRQFDTAIMALTIRQGLDGLAVRMGEPDYDILHHQAELLETLRRAMAD